MLITGSGCSKEQEAPFYRPGDATGDAGEQTGGDTGADIDEEPRTTDQGPGSSDDDPEAAPDLSATKTDPCDRFDARKVHLWGLRGVDPLGTVTTLLSSIVNELDSDRICFHWVSVVTPKVRPTDDHVLFRSTLGVEQPDGTIAQEDRLLELLPGDKSGEADQKEIPTPGCQGRGISTFHIAPSTGDILFNCAANCRSAVPFLQDVKACFDGPWFQSDGSLAVESALFAVGNNGTYLVPGSGFLGLQEPGAEERTSLIYEGDPIPEDERHVLARRAHNDGFWLLVGKWGGQRRRFSVGGDGVTVLDGVYPLANGEEVMGWVAAGTVANSWALDAEGNLYEDLGTKVVRSTLNGQQELAYDRPKPPLTGRTDDVYGGISAYLLTGP